MKNYSKRVLIILVITIVILLIFAGITIIQLAGNKLFEKKELLASQIDDIQFSYEKIEIAIKKMAILITIKDEKNGISQIEYPDGDILQCNGRNEIAIDLEINSNEEYKFKITSNNGYVKEVLIYEEDQILPQTLRNQWNLGVEHENLEIYQGTPVYNGIEEGAYLQNSVIATKENYAFNGEYTVILEAKNIVNNGWGFMLTEGYAAAHMSSYFWGLCAGTNGSHFASTGGGDRYQIWYGPLLRDDKWHRHTIKFDGTTFSYFIDNLKIGFNNSNSPKNTKLFIGGISNSGSSYGSNYWGYGNGHYRNLVIYDGALSDYAINNYTFDS